ncbi:Uncharacterized protein DBV15_09933 [Temnothorax longispinosus]|uniref:Uncharacterized protein n=1 Tax=Temnothorax longispinosus TaxID=300112 RepID=A0A4V6RGH7_9HYME|nr:Uncharacterized protein DBV15_09933 [Temnothorax longispinosus]
MTKKYKRIDGVRSWNGISNVEPRFQKNTPRTLKRGNYPIARALNYDTRNEFLPRSEWLTALSPGRAQRGAPAPDPKDVTRNEHTLQACVTRKHEGFDGRDKDLSVAFISTLLLELALQNERQTRTRRIPSNPPFRSRMPSGRLKPARRAPRRKTADLYFFVEGAAGRPVHGQEPSAFLIPGVPFIGS